MSVTNEQLQRLTLSAYRPSVTLQILALDEPGTVHGELSTIPRFGLGSNTRQGAAGTAHLRNDISLGGEKEAYLHRITCPMPAKALLGPHLCKELTPKTTESHWSGGQREP
jgi:hypothetical protein